MGSFWNPWGGGAGVGAPASSYMLWGPATWTRIHAIAPAVGAYSLDDADDKVAVIFVAAKDGTIDRIGFEIGSFVGAPPDYQVTLETTGGSDNNPTGTDYGGSAAGSFTPVGTGWVWVSLGTPATVTAGDIIAAVIGPTGAAPDGGNYISVIYHWGDFIEGPVLPRAVRYGTSWGSVSQRYCPISVRYDDGSVMPMVPATNFMSEVFDKDDDPDEIGCLLQVPFDCKCIGVRINQYGIVSSATQSRVRLYDAGGTPLRTKASLSVPGVAPGGVAMWDIFWDEQALSKNINYRLAVESTIAAQENRLLELTAPDADSRAALPEGSRWQRTARVNGGAWTETVTKLPLMGLWLSEVTVG